MRRQPVLELEVGPEVLQQVVRADLLHVVHDLHREQPRRPPDRVDVEHRGVAPVISRERDPLAGTALDDEVGQLLPGVALGC